MINADIAIRFATPTHCRAWGADPTAVPSFRIDGHPHHDPTEMADPTIITPTILKQCEAFDQYRTTMNHGDSLHLAVGLVKLLINQFYGG